jgi:hypothetical protein
MRRIAHNRIKAAKATPSSRTAWIWDQSTPDAAVTEDDDAAVTEDDDAAVTEDDTALIVSGPFNRKVC